MEKMPFFISPPYHVPPITPMFSSTFKITKAQLAKMFVENFKRYEDVEAGVEFAKAGPKI